MAPEIPNMTTKIFLSLWTIFCPFTRPGRFPGINRNAGNHGKDGKFYKSDQILNQTKTNINKSCLGKISLEKTLRIKFSVDSEFSKKLYDKKRKPRKARYQQKAF